MTNALLDPFDRRQLDRPAPHACRGEISDLALETHSEAVGFEIFGQVCRIPTPAMVIDYPEEAAFE